MTCQLNQTVALLKCEPDENKCKPTDLINDFQSINYTFYYSKVVYPYPYFLWYRLQYLSLSINLFAYIFSRCVYV